MAKAKKKKLEAVKRPAARDSLDMVIADINKGLQEGGAIQRGRDISHLTWDRMPSGSLGLDIIMGGGLPRAGITQYKGEESTAKTTMALQAAAAAQERGENVFWAASEGFDKHWARTNGAYIEYNEQELRQIVRIGRLPDMKAAWDFSDTYDAGYDGYGSFVLGQHPSGPQLLEGTSRIVRSGQCALVVLDSAGAILSEEDDDKDIGDPTRVGGNAKIIGHFVNKVRLALNQGTASHGGLWVPNKTAVVIINQMRAAIGGYSPRGTPPPEAPGGYGLKHGKDVDVRFTRGELLVAAGSANQRGGPYGRCVKAKVDKNKTASPYRDASWNLYFRTIKALGVRAGTIDLAAEVLEYGVYYEHVERSGAWFIIEGERFQGKEKAVEHLRENPDLTRTYHELILQSVGEGVDTP